MYAKILVPLDTSELAEQALPHAADIARRFDAEVELLTVVRASTEGPYQTDTPGDEFDPRSLEGQEYLGAVAGRMGADGLTVRTALRRGDVAEEVLAHSQDAGCDLIVVCTHGRSGLGRWVYGSITDRVLRYALVPVLLVRAGQS